MITAFAPAMRGLPSLTSAANPCLTPSAARCTARTDGRDSLTEIMPAAGSALAHDLASAEVHAQRALSIDGGRPRPGDEEHIFRQLFPRTAHLRVPRTNSPISFRRLSNIGRSRLVRAQAWTIISLKKRRRHARTISSMPVATRFWSRLRGVLRKQSDGWLGCEIGGDEFALLMYGPAMGPATLASRRRSSRTWRNAEGGRWHPLPGGPIGYR